MCNYSNSAFYCTGHLAGYCSKYSAQKPKQGIFHQSQKSANSLYIGKQTCSETKYGVQSDEISEIHREFKNKKSRCNKKADIAHHYDRRVWQDPANDPEKFINEPKYHTRDKCYHKAIKNSEFHCDHLKSFRKTLAFVLNEL